MIIMEVSEHDKNGLEAWNEQGVDKIHRKLKALILEVFNRFGG